jgi:predicted Zn-dependent peptidase
VVQNTVLDNGLRIVTEEISHFHSVAMGVWLNAGSRDEADSENGLSHFLEHMAFKGTPRRTVLDIAREIDQIGGNCNAFTSKEQTCFHGKVLADQLPRLVDLLSDVFLNPHCATDDLEKERRVILEEIYAQDDSPEELAQVLFTRSFWGDSPLGRPVLGEAARIGRVNRDDLLAYRRVAYRPEETVVAAAGRVNHQELVALVAPAFEAFSNADPSRPRPGAQAFPGVHLFPRDLEQVYLCLGSPGVAVGDQRRFAANMLQLILGGNMSSRLFQEIREQRGLVYSISAYLTFLSDTGLLEVAAGVSPQNLKELLTALRHELKRFRQEPVKPEELQAAREYVRGSIYLAAEDCDHLMMRLAKNELYFGHYIPLKDIVAGLMQVTAQEIMDLARELFQPERLNLTLLGPVDGDFSATLDF